MTSSESRPARLLEYAPWVLRDYLTNQGPSTAIVVLLIASLSIGPALALSSQAGEGIPDMLARRLLMALLEPLVFLGAFFATNGIVATDRKLGYYRFLFAKPVSPPRYYAMTFLLYGLGLQAITAALMGLWSLIVAPMFVWEIFAIVALMYLAYGGVGFLLSAAWRFDWLSLVTVMFAASVGWKLWGDADGLRHWLLYLLPPVHRDDEVYAIVLGEASRGVPWVSLSWLVGYGLVSFVAGIIVVRKRPLGTA